MEVPMFRRSPFVLPIVVGAMALSAAPALAGEEDPGTTPAPAPAPTPTADTASVHASHSCVAGHRVRAVVSGTDIARVAFSVNGKHVTTVAQPDSSGDFVLSMSCSRLTVGAHRASASVSFASGSNQTLRFQVTRTQATSPRFTG
jgi:hypothetical protein